MAVSMPVPDVGALYGHAAGALKAPASGLSWLQLAAATVFVLTVAIAWRQVTHFIMREI